MSKSATKHKTTHKTTHPNGTRKPPKERKHFTTGKRSITAQRVAREVLATVGKGEIPIIERIAKKNGYSINTARAGTVQKTKSYREIITPFISKLERERDRAIEAMQGKINDNSTKYRDLAYASDILIKNIQLLSGKSTENVALGVARLSDSELQALIDEPEIPENEPIEIKEAKENAQN